MRSFIAIVLVAVAARVTSAATFQLGARSDAFVSSANPTNNYGGAGAVAVSAGGLPQGEFASVMKFDFAAAKASFDVTFGAGAWTVTGLALQVTAASPNNAIFNSPAASGSFTIQWMQNDGWVEGSGTPNVPGGTGITFNTLSTFTSGSDQPLGLFTFSGGTSGSTTFTLDLAPGFVADVLAGGTASLLMSPSGASIAALFNSQSFNTASSRPVFTVTVVPEPASLALVVAGAAAGIGWRRRRGVTNPQR
jgi:hypothetical protein